MSIDWNKRVSNKSIAVVTVAPDDRGVPVLGKTLHALLGYETIRDAHAPLVTKTAEWLMAASDTPVADAYAVDEVIVDDDGMSVSLVYREGFMSIQISITTADVDCVLARRIGRDSVRDELLKLVEPEAGPQLMRAFAWLERADDDEDESDGFVDY